MSRTGPSAPQYPASLYQALEYRLVGPHRGGRVTAVAGVPGVPNTFYMGSTGGGIWKTEDGGESWRNISDGYFKSGSVGAIAVADADPNVIYAGMGSACIRNNVSPGDGVYKSVDGGRTWKHVGLVDAGQIGRVRIHPRNPDLIYAAVLGHAFGPNPERGVFRSKDGGTTWEKVLFVSDSAGAVDLAMDPVNPRILYAAIWQAVRKPWVLISGGEDSGLYKSSDGGDTWVKLAEGLPAGIKGRIGVAVSPANPGRIWALVEAKDGGLYRSDDGGTSFRLINSSPDLVARAFYYMHVYGDPLEENTVYLMGHGRGFLKSVDGGKSFESVAAPHGDHHDLWLDPKDPRIMINGNDGGANISYNGGRSWSTQANQPTAEIYSVTVDNQFLYRLYGAQQDNSTISIPSRTTGFGITSQDWYAVGGGEQGEIAVDPRNPNIVYAGNYQGQIERYDHGTGQLRNIQSYPQIGEGKPTKAYRHRFAIIAPIRVSPHDPKVLYHTSQFVHKSTDEGQSWTVISPDLSRNDKSKQEDSGGPITLDHTGTEVYSSIVAFEESAESPGLLWAGTDDGRVHVTRGGGANWEEVTPPTMPDWATVNSIELSAHDPGRAFLAVHRYRLDDYMPYVFRTNDYGKSWELLTDGRNGIPEKHFVRVVREDPDRKGLLYAGTEFGMYVSFNDGASWQSLQLNLPITPIMDLAVYRQDLVVATQGRSFWILDDLAPLHQLSDEVAGAQAHLYQPRVSYRLEGASVDRPRTGKNPPNGAVIYYHLGDAPREEVRLEFLDSSGGVIRALSSRGSAADRLSTQPGMNRFLWDLRYPGPQVLEGSIFWGSTEGPKAVPGTYQVRLSVGSWSQTRSLQVEKDPRLATSQAEFREQFDVAIQIRDKVTETHRALRAIREVRKQSNELVERARRAGSESEIAGAARALDEKLSAIEQTLTQTKLPAGRFVFIHEPQLDNEFVYLYSTVLSADTRPTAAASQRFDDLKPILADQLARLRQALDTDLARLNALAREKGVPAVVPPTP
ncbi:MAG: glycosyl hydrolase [Gemmatimonadetes bacterium]|nr:glycosyl hydrolase [Gemmatimonadota bacterium]